MSNIQVLPEAVVNQIAAGEVVERPANVLKELLENSLDARATRIDIIFRSGGSSFIQISDNGVGMNEMDAELCFKRHATSKLRQINDLQQIHSFGFRGEALPSIASVARVILITRTSQSDLGVKIEMEGGICMQKTSCSCPIGTTFIVQQLFYNVPVRRKFLKSEATESAHLIHYTRLYALSYPEVHFTLKQDQHLIFSSPSCTSLEDRILELWPKRSRKHWLPLNFSNNTISITGLISPPGEGVLNTQDIFIFLNKRPINNTFFLTLLKECYRGFIPLKTYPSAFLFITLPGTDVDVNIHPTKREVRFKHEVQLRKWVSDAIQFRLGDVQIQPLSIEHKTDAAFHVNPVKTTDVKDWVCANTFQRFEKPNIFSSLMQNFKSDPIYQDPLLATKPNLKSEVTTAAVQEPTSDDLNTTPISPKTHLNFFALWQNRYAFFSEPPFLIVLDCEGAQKRLWYERIRMLLQKEQVGPLQTLLFPHDFDLKDIHAACLYESIDYLKFKKICMIQALSEHQFQLQAIPTWLPLKEVNVFIEQLVESLLQWGQNQPLERFLAPLLQQLLKKIVVPELASQIQVENLYRELQSFPTSLTDPSGNRIWNRWTARDLLKADI